jgi:hypothetical protein
MSEFRDNYFKAREIVADELKQKHNLVESYRDENRLTLDSSKYSIHLTFYVPDGDEISVSIKGKQPGEDGQNFMGYLFDQYPKLDDIDKALKEIFTKLPKKASPYSIDNLYIHFNDKIRFLENHYPHFFSTID